MGAVVFSPLGSVQFFFFFFLPPLFLSSLPISLSPVYKAFAQKLQRITRHTPFRGTEPYCFSVTSSSSCVRMYVCVYVCEYFEQKLLRSDFLPALPTLKKIK